MVVDGSEAFQTAIAGYRCQDLEFVQYATQPSSWDWLVHWDTSGSRAREKHPRFTATDQRSQNSCNRGCAVSGTEVREDTLWSRRGVHLVSAVARLGILSAGEVYDGIASAT